MTPQGSSRRISRSPPGHKSGTCFSPFPRGLPGHEATGQTRGLAPSLPGHVLLASTKDPGMTHASVLQHSRQADAQSRHFWAQSFLISSWPFSHSAAQVSHDLGAGLVHRSGQGAVTGHHGCRERADRLAIHRQLMNLGMIFSMLGLVACQMLQAVVCRSRCRPRCRRPWFSGALRASGHGVRGASPSRPDLQMPALAAPVASRPTALAPRTPSSSRRSMVISQRPWLSVRRGPRTKTVREPRISRGCILSAVPGRLKGSIGVARCSGVRAM